MQPAMNVLVCVKQIPDPNAPGKLDPQTKRLVREGVDLVLDPGDEHGVEAGLQLVEKDGGEVTVISMGPPKALEAIRRALAMGAHRGIMQAKNKEVKQVGLKEIGLEGQAGKAALTQEVIEAAPAEPRKAGEVIDDKGEGAKRVAEFLKELKVI